MKIKAEAVLKNLKPRKQWRGDEDELCVDLKFDIESIHVQAIMPMLGLETVEVAKSIFWDKDGLVKVHGISVVKLWVSTTRNCKLKVLRKTTIVDKLTKIEFKPLQGFAVNLVFTIILKEPDQALVDDLMKEIEGTVKIDVTGEDDLFIEDDDDETEEEEDEA